MLDRRLSNRQYIAGDYSIADMASWPWLIPYKHLGQSLESYPNVRRWHEAMKSRPAVRAGVDLGKELRRSAPPSEEERQVLFNQTGGDQRRRSGPLARQGLSPLSRRRSPSFGGH